MIENLVTSLEVSKRLFEKGIKNKSYFVWVKYPDGEWQVVDMEYANCKASKDTTFYYQNYKNDVKDWLYPAYLLSELLEMVPENVTIIHIGMLSGGYAVTYETNKKKTELNMETGKNLADALAELIFLGDRE